MKIQIVSDLHLEFLNTDQVEELADRISYNTRAETLILAGDICSWSEKRIKNLYLFLDILVDRYHEIIYVLGNHEYYGSSYNEVKFFKWKVERNRPNLFILENQYQVTESSINESDSVTVYGTTLWFEETVEAQLLKYNLNDYRCIQDFDPDAWSRKAIQFIKNIPDDESKKVLITHHVPHSRFISEKYVGNDMNCFYLNEIGKYLDKFNLVIFGHSHESVDYQFSDRCRAISNPRGYLDSPNKGSNDKFQYQLIVEV